MNITAVLTRTAGSTRPCIDWHFTPGSKPFEAAVANAPVGFRLPSRVELVEGVDSGDLDGYTETVWSSTESKEQRGQVWAILLKDGSASVVTKESSHQTIYAREIATGRCQG